MSQTRSNRVGGRSPDKASAGMSEYLYTVWLRDASLRSEDQDHEFPACIVIRARRAEHARAWGDHLAKSLCSRRPEMTFLHSSLEGFDPSTDGLSDLPRIEAGYEAPDDEIGW